METRKIIGKFTFSISFLISACIYTKLFLGHSITFRMDSINQTSSYHCVSILHCNIRSLRNKLDYILDNFCDFDLICFTETHLDSTISSENLFL